MPLIVETADDFAQAEYIGAKAGHTRTPGVALDVTAAAVVNHGRWIVECPWCPSARLAAPGRPFWCPSCGNAQVGGQAVAVVWPDDPAGVERVLMVRPVGNRNMLAGETLEVLVGENEAHDLPVGV